jgi:hypothetical protein
MLSCYNTWTSKQHQEHEEIDLKRNTSNHGVPMHTGRTKHGHNHVKQWKEEQQQATAAQTNIN